VESPDGSEYAARLSLAGQSLVTSGSYQRFYTVDGVAYHHIIDPATRMPASYVSSVSVLADSSALADALSTALFCMSYEEGAALVASYSDVGVLWILPDGEQRMNEAFRAHLANT
jgi:thiamine biosynthesis lipoprotein